MSRRHDHPEPRRKATGGERPGQGFSHSSKDRPNRRRAAFLLALLLLAAGAWGWRRHQRAVAVETALARGRDALATGDTASAQRAFRRALELDRRSVEAHRRLGRLAVERHDPETAILHFAAVTELQPRSAEALTDLGIARLESGDWGEALRTFQRALRIAPTSVLALEGLGETYRRGQRWDDAVAALEQAHRLQPGRPRTLSLLGLALAQRGRTAADAQRALVLLDEARRSGIPEPQIRYGMGLAYLAAGRLPEAIAALETTARIALDDEQALFRLGEAYRRAGRLADAQRVLAQHRERVERRRRLRGLRERLSAQPNDTECRRQLAEAYLESRNHREAVRNLLVLSQAGSTDPRVYDLLARAWSGLGLSVPARQARDLAAQLRGNRTSPDPGTADARR